MKLGIVVVYLLHDEDEPLLQAHLELFGRYTEMPYHIYGSVNRLQPQFRAILEQRPEVSAHELVPTELRSSAEHSHYLRQLLELAIADGATHLLVTHVDCCPVRQGWDWECLRLLQTGAAFVAVRRSENADEPVPHTAFIFMPTSFYQKHGPITVLPGEDSSDPAFEKYRADCGTSESGVPFGYWAERAGLTWHGLTRSNMVDDHAIAGGIYGDVVFHLGGNAHGGWWFRRDWQATAAGRLRSRLRLFIPARWRRPLPHWLKRLLLPQEAARAARNVAAFALVKSRFITDPDGYLAYLRQQAPPPPTQSRLP